MSVSLNVIKQGNQVLMAVCDLELLGKTLKFGSINFEVRKDFYGGSIVSVDEAIDLLKQGTSANMVGSAIIKRAVEEGLIHSQAILFISGVPHAQRVRM